VLGPAGLGLIIGSAFTPLIVRRLHYPRTVAIGVILLSLCTILLTLARAVAQAVHHIAWWEAWPYLAAAYVLIFLVGVALDFINVPAQTRMQEHAPDWIKGRILALQGMLLNAATVPSVIAIGLLADFFDLTTAMDVLAVVIVLAGLGSVYRSLRADPRAHDKQTVKLVH
jgi:MFS family permease